MTRSWMQEVKLLEESVEKVMARHGLIVPLAQLINMLNDEGIKLDPFEPWKCELGDAITNLIKSGKMEVVILSGTNYGNEFCLKQVKAELSKEERYDDMTEKTIEERESIVAPILELAQLVQQKLRESGLTAYDPVRLGNNEYAVFTDVHPGDPRAAIIQEVAKEINRS